jgi:ABC-2 type transport system ATP-binding protein
VREAPDPGGASPRAAIAIRGLTKSYDGVPAVAGLDLDVAVGETLALLGPNGAGKTTTVECCMGYRIPDAGGVRVLGLDPRRDRAALAPRVGLMLQEGGVYPHAYPDEMLHLFAAYYRVPRDPEQLLERVGLASSRRTRFRDLSGGQKQRLSLALALIGRPEVVYLDEPTTGLDVAARRSAWELIEELQADRVTVVLTTHLLDEAEHLADRVAIIDRGHLIAQGTLSELTRAEQSRVAFQARAGLDVVSLAAALQAPVSEPTSGHYLVETVNTPQLLVRLSGWLAERGEPLDALHAGRSSLEDVFLRLTGDDVPTGDDVEVAP